MPHPKLLYLYRRSLKGGTVYDFRRSKTSPRIRINGPYMSEQFMAEYHAAFMGTTAPKSPLKAKPGSLRWLVDHWRLSSDWASTSKATQRQRDNILAHVLGKNGDVSFSAITSKHIKQGREDRKATPSAANNFLKTMRALFSWAVEAEHLKLNPAAEVKFISQKTDGHQPWSADEIEAFRNRWVIGTRQRVAFEIVYFTGLRRGDAVRLGRQHIGADGVAAIKTEKTGTEVFFNITSELMAALEAGPTGDMVFITGSDGQPMTKESFGNSFREWCLDAGVQKSAHGLRKVAAAEAAERGASEKQLQAMFGWETNHQSSLYTKSASRKKLALEGQATRSNVIKIGTKSAPHSATSTRRVGNPGKK